MIKPQEKSIIERLREQRNGMLPSGEYAFLRKKDIEELFAVIDRLTAERDEARRQICSTVVFPSSPQEYANRRGWDCYKEDGK